MLRPRTEQIPSPRWVCSTQQSLPWSPSSVIPSHPSQGSSTVLQHLRHGRPPCCDPPRLTPPHLTLPVLLQGRKYPTSQPKFCPPSVLWTSLLLCCYCTIFPCLRSCIWPVLSVLSHQLINKGWSLLSVKSALGLSLTGALCFPWKNRLLLLSPFYLPANSPPPFVSVLPPFVFVFTQLLSHQKDIFLVLILPSLSTATDPPLHSWDVFLFGVWDLFLSP